MTTSPNPSAQRTPEPTDAPTDAATANPPARTAPERTASNRLTIYADPELLERARNALMALLNTPHGHYRSLTALAAGALAREVDRLEAEHNGGQPFPQRHGSLPTGPRT